MQSDLFDEAVLADVVSRLAPRYSQDLGPESATAYNVAAGVRTALSRDGASVSARGMGGVPTVDVLAALLLIPAARQELDTLEAALIEAVLDRGVTWEQLGAAYGGRTRQTMQQLYRRRGATRSWAPGRFPALASTSIHGDAGVVSQEIAEVAGTWRVDLRRGCRPGQHVLQEVLPVIVRLEALGLSAARRPWPEWLARDRTLPRRVRSAVRAFDRVRESGSTVVVRAASLDSP